MGTLKKRQRANEREVRARIRFYMKNCSGRPWRPDVFTSDGLFNACQRLLVSGNIKLDRSGDGFVLTKKPW